MSPEETHLIVSTHEEQISLTSHWNVMKISGCTVSTRIWLSGSFYHISFELVLMLDQRHFLYPIDDETPPSTKHQARPNSLFY
jgi:hypothetical protein